MQIDPKLHPTATATALGQLDDIVADIKKVSASLGIPPTMLSHSKYLRGGGKYILGNHSALTTLGGYRYVVNSYFPPVVLPGVKNELDKVKGEQRKIIRSLGEGESFFVELEKALAKMPKIPNPGRPYKFGRKTKTNRAIGVVVSDLHIGHDVDPEETNHKYGRVEEARTVAHITRTVCEYKIDYRKETELHVFMIGDMIENILHGNFGQDLLHIQTCRAIYILTQMLKHFSSNFKTVHVYCIPGNHDRDTAIHKSRAISQKYNALGTTIYYAIHNGVRDRKNIIWKQPKTPWLDVTILGHRIYATHGDTNFSIGNPGSKIDTSRIETKMNRINASLRDRDEYKIFIGGHVHTGLVMRMNNGCYLIVNGGGVTPDSYVNTMDIMESPQSQVMFEITEKYAVGDSRFIEMSGVAKEAKLDKIIVPYENLEK